VLPKRARFRLSRFPDVVCCPVTDRIDLDSNHEAVGGIGLTMGNAAKAFETSTNRSDRQLFIGLPTPRGDNSGTMTANVDSGSDFERRIV